MKNVIIKNVDNFKVIDNELVYNSLNSIFNSSHIIFQSKSKLWGQIISKNLFFIKNDEERGILNLNQGFNVIDFPENLNIINGTYDSVSNTIIGGRILHDMILSYSKINLITFKEDSLKFQFDYSFPTIANELYFFQKNDNVVCFKEYTETTLWQYSEAELGAEKVSKILGVFGQVLVVVCGYSKEIERPNGQKNTYPYEKIIGLNKDNGQLLYEVDGYELDGEYKLFGPSSCSLLVNNEGETILHALIGFYLTFDTQTGETKTLNIDVQAHDRGISAVKSASIDGDAIGFSAFDFKVGGFDSAVGVFNTKTLKIEDHYTNEEANKEGAFFGPGQPKIHGNKIYALDTKNTLYIFEREDDTLNLNQ